MEGIQCCSSAGYNKGVIHRNLINMDIKTLIVKVLDAVTGFKGSTEKEGSTSMRMEGILAVAASLVVAYGVKKGITLAPGDVTMQLSMLAAGGASLWYGFGSIRAVYNWFAAKFQWKGAFLELPVGSGTIDGQAGPQ